MMPQHTAQPRQSVMQGSHPRQPSCAHGQMLGALGNIGVLEAQVGSLQVRGRVEPRVDLRLKSWEAIAEWPTHMEMRMQCALPAVGHEDLHLANGQILDVFVLGASVLDVGLAAKTDWLVLFPEDAGSLDGQGAPFLPHTSRGRSEEHTSELQ